MTKKKIVKPKAWQNKVYNADPTGGQPSRY